jgi:hypothetical protein
MGPLLSCTGLNMYKTPDLSLLSGQPPAAAANQRPDVTLIDPATSKSAHKTALRGCRRSQKRTTSGRSWTQLR